MGEVYRARDVRLGRTVALKVVAPHIAGSADADLRARFEREARAIAALDDPHICSVYDVGEHDGLLYLVMPCLEGQTLAARLATRRPLPLDDVLRIGLEVAGAMERTHRAHITHRDLKPANIMLTSTGAKLLDFGLAKVLAPSTANAAPGVTQLAPDPPVTTAGTLIGTVHYMAPEQVEGREADARSDVWAFGAVVYEMATGHRPFDGPSAAAIIGAILRDQPPPISSRQPLAPRLLDHVVARCLAKDPDERWQNIGDVGGELRWIAESRADTPAEGLAPASCAARLAPVAERGHRPGDACGIGRRPWMVREGRAGRVLPARFGQHRARSGPRRHGGYGHHRPLVDPLSGRQAHRVRLDGPSPESSASRLAVSINWRRRRCPAPSARMRRSSHPMGSGSASSRPASSRNSASLAGNRSRCATRRPAGAGVGARTGRSSLRSIRASADCRW